MMMPLVPRQTVRENDLNETAEYVTPKYSRMVQWAVAYFLQTLCNACCFSTLSNSITMNRVHICFSCQYSASTLLESN